MKHAAAYFAAFTAFAVIALTFVLVNAGTLHPFYMRAIAGLVIIVFVFFLTLGE